MAGIDHFSTRLQPKYAWFHELLKHTFPLLVLTPVYSIGVRFGVRSGFVGGAYQRRSRTAIASRTVC